jgi:aryl-alcohol dehydrogenase-like predicted oxidoreductase
MGERKSERGAELKAIKLGLELGIRLIDTAEMYGEGIAEEIVGEAWVPCATRSISSAKSTRTTLRAKAPSPPASAA